MQNTDWYLVQCKSRQDERAEQNLLNQGIQIYRPQQLVERIRYGERTTRNESLFPGYLFVQLDTGGLSWSRIRSTRGVNRVVSFGGLPLPVGAGLVEALRGRQASAGRISALKAGDKVRISEGAFRELEAIYLRDDGEERVILLLNLLQRQQQLSFPLRSVRSAN